jgi:hypothetical protein
VPSAVEGPSPEAELTLLLAGGRGRRERARERIAELAAVADETALAAFLLRQRLLLLVGTRLTQAAAVNGAFAERLERTLALARARAMLFAAATERLTRALEARGIRAVALKGAGLAQELYGDGALRAYDDIDVLVARQQLGAAVDVARSLGWTAGGPEDGVAAEPPLLHYALRHPDGALPELELHWRVHWYEEGYDAAMLERSSIGDGLRTLAPVDQLAALLLFYARDGFAGLRLAADIAAWWDRNGSRDLLVALETLTGEHPNLAEPWRVSLAVAAGVAGLRLGTLPPSLRVRRRRSLLACRLANWDLRGDDDQIKANVTLVDGLLAPRGGLRGFVGRNVLPPPRFLAATYGVPPGAHGRAWAWRAVHAAKTLVRYALALGRLLRGRSWSPPP